MHARAKITTKEPGTKKAYLVSRAQKPDFSHSTNSPIDNILHLQRTIGNQAVQRLFRFGAIQAKLRIGQPNDIYEQEADRVAEQVMGTTVGSDVNTIQKQEKEFIQQKPT